MNHLINNRIDNCNCAGATAVKNSERVRTRVESEVFTSLTKQYKPSRGLYTLQASTGHRLYRANEIKSVSHEEVTHGPTSNWDKHTITHSHRDCHWPAQFTVARRITKRK